MLLGPRDQTTAAGLGFRRLHELPQNRIDQRMVHVDLDVVVVQNIAECLLAAVVAVRLTDDQIAGAAEPGSAAASRKSLSADRLHDESARLAAGDVLPAVAAVADQRDVVEAEPARLGPEPDDSRSIAPSRCAIRSPSAIRRASASFSWASKPTNRFSRRSSRSSSRVGERRRGVRPAGRDPLAGVGPVDQRIAGQDRPQIRGQHLGHRVLPWPRWIPITRRNSTRYHSSRSSRSATPSQRCVFSGDSADRAAGEQRALRADRPARPRRAASVRRRRRG